MKESKKIHTLTHHAIDTLQSAYQNVHKEHAEGLILSALVTVKHVHDLINPGEESLEEMDPEEYCAAI